LPQPAAPQTSVGLPLGKPPPVISSPMIPDGHFSRDRSPVPLENIVSPAWSVTRKSLRIA
jgi:hypothetical protein